MVYNNVEMFNLQHILYMVISFLLTAVLLVWCGLKVKDQYKKNSILVLSAVLTVVIHYSNVWVEFFTSGGTNTVEANHILPVYPCNVVMWMLLLCAVIKNKTSVIFRLLSDFCFFGGIVCGIIGIMFNANFDSTPTLLDYYVLKGLLSHSTMLFGCIYLMVGGYVKIGVFNALSVTFGLATFVVCGLFVNKLYTIFNMTPPDGMFLLSNPYFPISPMILGVIAIIIMFVVLALYEQQHLPEEQRWYFKLKNLYKNEENTKEKEEV